MKISADTKLYGLIGHPVSKSLSPVIHNSSFEKLGIDAKYLVFDVLEKDLQRVIEGFRGLGVAGFNVTSPHKIKIMKYLDDLDQTAKQIGAVNTVSIKEGKLIGYNTDGLGFIQSLEDTGVDLEHKRVLMLGSGGAARAIALTLASHGVGKIDILNRTLERGKILAGEIGSNTQNIEVGYGSLNDTNRRKDTYDIIINTTSVGMYPNIDALPLEPDDIKGHPLVYDIIYKPRETKLLRKAGELGLKTMTGLDMLINQAILSEKIWFPALKHDVFMGQSSGIRRKIEKFVE